MTWLRRYPNLTAFLVVGAGLGLLPQFVDNDYILTVAVLIGVFAILTVGLSLLMGYSGQISLGQATFAATGAYLTAILSTRFGLPIAAALVVGVLLSGLLGYLLGHLIFRVRGHYLAMATLGMNVIVFLALTQEVEWTGGPSGLRGVPDLAIGPLALSSDLHYYYLVWACALLVVGLSLNIVNSRVGRAMRALHASEVAAEAVGIDTNDLKVKVFALSALYGGLAGALQATFLGFISPSQYGIGVSIEIVVMAVVGGLASVWGALFGAAAVVVIEQWLRTAVKAVIPNAAGEYEVIAFGLILILIMMFLPEGLVTGAARRLALWLRTRARGAAAEG